MICLKKNNNETTSHWLDPDKPRLIYNLGYETMITLWNLNQNRLEDPILINQILNVENKNNI